MDAKILIEAWRRHYNEDRPHSALGQMTPLQFKSKLLQKAPDTTIVPQE